MPAEFAAPLTDALKHLRETRRERGAHFERLAEQLPEGELSAPRDVLRELLAVAIDEAGERVSRDSARLLRGDGTAAELRAALDELGALLDLLETVLRSA